MSAVNDVFYLVLRVVLRHKLLESPYLIDQSILDGFLRMVQLR